MYVRVAPIHSTPHEPSAHPLPLTKRLIVVQSAPPLNAKQNDWGARRRLLRFGDADGLARHQASMQHEQKYCGMEL